MQIYKDIIDYSLGDYRAVTTSANARIPGKGFSEWKVLLRDWYAANFFCQSYGLYGYKNAITVNALEIEGENNEYALAPGEGVYSYLSGSLSEEAGNTLTAPPFGSHIQYTGLDYGNAIVKPSFPFNEGYSENFYLLTLNTNTAINAALENGFVTNIQAPMNSQKEISRNMNRSMAASYKAPELWEWDSARYFRDKLKEPDPNMPVRTAGRRK
jgi:hypothetical protein